LQIRQEGLASSGARDPAYAVPYTTVHAGIMHGGEALNIVPGSCQIDFEIRHIAADDPETILSDLRVDAQDIVAPYRDRFEGAAITIETLSSYPGLDTPADSPTVTLVAALLDSSLPTIKVAYGTEGGLFAAGLDIPVLICGPGEMAQGHKPDEYVEVSQLEECGRFLARLVDVLDGSLPR